ncbi:hypothetical protein CEF21_15905 [Bacillus sp. FJAT-42376]|uniref:hypothetical protein n=1 Tax=Bacillus sp. FJAT-42376 TaxID=2014076 RepID=UPI000F4E1A92|nr:hypothetical protein [Bacillus sp. FJAT-42376]AZB43673.1 hypothetical protein CEF21_15905 [Bacillus sp. FJAT-42376]
MNAISSLIDAVTNNPVLSGAVIWIGGLLVSFLFKERVKEPEKKPEKKKRAQDSSALKKTQVHASMQEVYQKAKERSFTNDFSGSEQELAVVKLKKSAAGTQTVRNPVIQGMIWAEIIGKPRSLNPHHTRQRKIRP